MITPIEIKVNLAGDVADALTRLRCSRNPAVERRIWFAESRSDGSGAASALLSSRIVIRLRSGERDDLTVKLRPCRRSQLAGRWTTPFTDDALEYRIEGDWCGERRVLSASAVGERRPGSLRDAAMVGADVTAALDSGQRQFLVSCTPPGVAVDHLSAMGPIASTKWTNVRLGDLEVDVERWCTAELELLELSHRVTARHPESRTEMESRAVATQLGFESVVRRHGFSIANGETKTEQVLAALVARSRRQ
ncbi:hypothetical protein AB0M22_22445 [Nocardia sp. NPDC051756]|uniref:hypothetical protein n=1 Tax=Nocardia sp. NPDC051756 TaxID=3154751 RepID=UPI003438EFF4